MRTNYESPFSTRYASKEMQYLFSADFKFKTWRRLWIALAKAEKELGLDITDEQIAELEAHKDDINYEVAEAREKEVRHDVMSHVYAYGVPVPQSAGDHPFGCDFLLCGRQYRYSNDARSDESGQKKTFECDFTAF